MKKQNNPRKVSINQRILSLICLWPLKVTEPLQESIEINKNRFFLEELGFPNENTARNIVSSSRLMLNTG